MDPDAERPSVPVSKREEGQLTASVPRETEAYVKLRAQRLGWTRNRFCKQLFDWWIEHGAPPVHPLEYLRSGEADAVGFGKLYIANPDLAHRFAWNAPLNTPEPKTFFAQGTTGYTDYPALG